MGIEEIRKRALESVNMTADEVKALKITPPKVTSDAKSECSCGHPGPGCMCR